MYSYITITELETVGYTSCKIQNISTKFAKIITSSTSPRRGRLKIPPCIVDELTIKPTLLLAFPSPKFVRYDKVNRIITFIPQGLNLPQKTLFKVCLNQAEIKYYETELFYEVETTGAKILNLFANELKVITQSMAIEESDMGGRHVQVQKLVWTMYKETD